jgi:hypothetical protein
MIRAEDAFGIGSGVARAVAHDVTAQLLHRAMPLLLGFDYDSSVSELLRLLRALAHSGGALQSATID